MHSNHLSQLFDFVDDKYVIYGTVLSISIGIEIINDVCTFSKVTVHVQLSLVSQ